MVLKISELIAKRSRCAAGKQRVDGSIPGGDIYF